MDLNHEVTKAMEKRIRLCDGLFLELMEIPSGSFLMGSPPSEKGRYDDEGPQHKVTLQSFYLGRTPITQAQWREVAGWVEGPGERWGCELNPKPSRYKGDQRPVECVTWYEAMEFCSRLSQRTGRQFTLPSEAQWEYACRAGTTTPFYCGETLSDELANYNNNNNKLYTTTDVASFPPNPWGLYDMHGNIWEWCLDAWHDNYNGAPTDGRPWLEEECLGKSYAAGVGTTPRCTAAQPTASTPTPPLASTPSASVCVSCPEEENESANVLRGGSWYFFPVRCRSASRDSSHPANANFNIGFRVCCPF